MITFMAVQHLLHTPIGIKEIEMKQIVLISMMALSIQAQTWTASTVATKVVIDGLRVDFIGLVISTNMTASGVLSVSKMSGSNAISRATIQLTPKAVTDILANCGGITLQQLGNLLLVSGGLPANSDFITRVEIYIDPRTGKAKLNASTITGKKKVIDEAIVNQAMVQSGGSVAIFQNSFLAYAKANAK